MKKLNRTQTVGVIIVVFVLFASLVVDNPLIGVPLGVLCAIGIGFTFKWIAFKK